MSELLHCPHCGGKLDDLRVISWGGWTLDEAAGLLDPGGIRLSRSHTIIAGVLLRAEGRPVKATAVCAALYAEKDAETQNERGALRALLVQLRARVPDLVPVADTRGFGYRVRSLR